MTCWTDTTTAAKTYYSIAVTVMEIGELKTALSLARRKSAGLALKEKS